MNPLTQLRAKTPLFFISLVLAYGQLSPGARAVVPPPDGGYPNFNTAEGTFSLLSLTTGSGNTALGGRALQSNTTTSDNTAVGYGALFSNNASLNTAVGFDALFGNTTGRGNSATGARALLRNTIGAFNTADGNGALLNNLVGSRNTANGVNALFSNQAGVNNTAVGANALYHNGNALYNDGSNYNTALGDSALFSNTSGSDNTAIGFDALSQNTTGRSNTAIGVDALASGDSSYQSTAVGWQAASHGAGLYNTVVGASALGALGGGETNGNTAIGYYVLAENTTGYGNTAIGLQALFNNTIGSFNVGLGLEAGHGLTTGNYNIDIGAATLAPTTGSFNIDIGVSSYPPDESNTTRIGSPVDPTGRGQNRVFIAGISSTTLDNGVPVVIDTATDQLGVLPSSQRFKADIKPMDKASEAILALRPVTFCYESSNTGAPQFGLIAEEVAKVSPDLVVRDKEGKPYSVRYDAVNAMLLNEFLTEHKAFVEEQRKVQEQGATIARLEQQIEALTVGLQKVSAQLAAANGAAGMRGDIDRSSREADTSGSELVNPSNGGLELSRFATGRIRLSKAAPPTVLNDQ